MDDEVLTFVRERGEVAFPDVNAAFDADTGAVFRACRRLARSGDIHAVLPLVYRAGDGLADGERAGESATGRTPSRESADAAEPVVDDDSDGVDGDGDGGGFERVENG